ncbi:hypothetical protein CDAR_405001 [Caerostris darwini]|uniref:Uncharacterized protein n=1 Tax=Caerostris darwini TaxID=1538125 RepID=A0AAV4U6R5_9ARAC|nr:hypothetical protein CDAR_405001 [Caerostris darwini]
MDLKLVGIEKNESNKWQHVFYKEESITTSTAITTFSPPQMNFSPLSSLTKIYTAPLGDYHPTSLNEAGPNNPNKAIRSTKKPISKPRNRKANKCQQPPGNSPSICLSRKSNSQEKRNRS